MQFWAVIAKLVLTYVNFYAFQSNYHPPPISLIGLENLTKYKKLVKYWGEKAVVKYYCLLVKANLLKTASKMPILLVIKTAAPKILKGCFVIECFFDASRRNHPLVRSRIQRLHASPIRPIPGQVKLNSIWINISTTSCVPFLQCQCQCQCGKIMYMWKKNIKGSLNDDI